MTTSTLTPTQRTTLLRLFGLRAEATQKDLHRAWRAKARALHKGGLDAQKEARLSALNASYDLLCAAFAAPATPQAATPSAPKRAPRAPKSPRACGEAHIHLVESGYFMAAWSHISHIARRATQQAFAALGEADPLAVRLGLPTRHLMAAPDVIFHVARHLDITADGKATVTFPSQIQPGRNILIVPVFDPAHPYEAGKNGVYAVQIHHDEGSRRSCGIYTATPTFLNGTLHMRFQGLEAPEQFSPRSPLPSGCVALWGGEPALAERRALATRLDGDSPTWLRPFLHVWHSLRTPKAYHKPAAHPNTA